MKEDKLWLVICCVVCLCVVFLSYAGSYAVTALSENMSNIHNNTIVIDAGHGGEDGGALSPNGVPESQYNLNIALRLEQLFHLLGVPTIMVRTEDVSVYTEGKSLAERKRSDLKERTRIANNPNSILLSIHQNNFPDGRYSGAQVFYSKTAGSKELAESLQHNLIQSLNKTSNRAIKKTDGIYLMEHVKNPAVLIECGFLSNDREELLLRTSEYQKQLSIVIAVTVKNYMDELDQANA